MFRACGTAVLMISRRVWARSSVQCMAHTTARPAQKVTTAPQSQSMYGRFEVVEGSDRIL